MKRKGLYSLILLVSLSCFIGLYKSYDLEASNQRSRISINKNKENLLETNSPSIKKQGNLAETNKKNSNKIIKTDEEENIRRDDLDLVNEKVETKEDVQTTPEDENNKTSYYKDKIKNNTLNPSKIKQENNLNKKMYVKNNLNLREKPNLNSKILFIIPSTSEVVFNYDSGDYSNVTFKGLTGFASNEYLTEEKLDILGECIDTDNKIVGPTYINGILIVNKEYTLPRSYAPGESSVAREAFKRLKKEARESGLNLVVFSSYRSYDYQNGSYNNRVKQYGESNASKWTAKAGQSEHQSGLAFDIGESSRQDQWARKTFHSTEAAKWLKHNSHKHGFIIRYPKGKEYITGFNHESWHLRYVGIDHATEIYKRDITLEEYLGIK
ncbi:MAG: SH3 domain-containing protein [Clostridium sp.]|nr:SH3 domain-containing protein [Clostridium sp.]